jgi:two-component system OmpR family response regulator
MSFRCMLARLSPNERRFRLSLLVVDILTICGIKNRRRPGYDVRLYDAERQVGLQAVTGLPLDLDGASRFTCRRVVSLEGHESVISFENDWFCARGSFSPLAVAKECGGRVPDAAPFHDLRVLLIEDEREIALAMQQALLRSGIQSVLAHSGAQAVSLKPTFLPDVVLVDLVLPDIDGETLVRWLVDEHDCGIIVVSGRSDESSRVLNLELGADDYVIKPCSPRELVARIRSVYRRSSLRHVPHRRRFERGISAVGEYTVNLETRTIRDRMAQLVNVTSAEFAVIAALIEAEGLPVSRAHLSEVALRRPWRSEDRSVDQLVLRLRRKLSMPEGGHGIIQSIRNAGYVLVGSDASEG